MATLLNAGSMINSSLDFEEVIRGALETLSRVINAEAGSIILIEGDELVITDATGPSADSVRGFRFPKGSGIAGWVIDRDETLIVHDVATDGRWFEGIDLSSEFKTSSILCVPLRARGRMLGVIELLNKAGGERFDEWDLSLLQVFCNQVGVAVDNARLHEEALGRERLRTELTLATKIQRGLLPDVLPQPDGYQLAGMSVSCEEVAGDYYDVIHLTGGRLGLAVADVSGKGIPAAMLTTSVRTALRAETRFDVPLPELFTRMNDLLYQEGSGMFATCVYAVLDPKERTLKVANAGHCLPLVLHADGTYDELDSTGIPLGLFPTGTAPFDSLECNLREGDFLLIYSDGIPEASREDGEQLGEERLIEAARESYDESAEVMCQRIYDAMETFAGDAPSSDDVTLMALKVL